MTQQELLAFLEHLNRYVQSYPGTVREAFQFRAGARFSLGECPPGILRREKAGTYLFHAGQPLDFVYILLDGVCCVEKYKRSGDVFTDSSRRPLQMFGFLEGVAGIGYYTATMRCAGDCAYVKAPVADCLRAVRSRPDLTWLALQFLASFSADYIDASDVLILNDPKYNLLLKLYQYCLGKTFPVTVRWKKEELASGLNLNLRTVYRYLAQFYEAGLLSPAKGKITISREQHQAIGKRLSVQYSQRV